MHQRGVELAIFRSLVQRPTTTLPHQAKPDCEIVPASYHVLTDAAELAFSEFSCVHINKPVYVIYNLGNQCNINKITFYV